MTRREFGASSERLVGQQSFMVECLDALDPEAQEAQRALQAARDQAIGCLGGEATAAATDAGDTPDAGTEPWTCTHWMVSIWPEIDSVRAILDPV